MSAVCFFAWVFSVYDYTLFGTLLPVIADDFGWSTAFAAGINTCITVGVFAVAAPHMVATDWGSIISISSQLGLKGGESLTHYSGAKAGVLGFTKAAKQAELPLGRFGRPEEVAPTAVLLAGDPGGNLHVGQTLGPNSGDVMP